MNPPLSPAHRALFEQLMADAGLGVASGSIARRASPDRAALSFQQERLWFIDQLQPGESTYVLPLAVRMKGCIDLGALTASIRALVARHEALRTRFTVERGQPVQRVTADVDVPISIDDIGACGGASGDLDAAVAAAAAIEANRGFDLTGPPPFRVRVSRVDADDHVLLLTMHHLIADGRSMEIMARDLSALYAAAVSRLPPVLPDLSVQYGDYAEWQRRVLTDAALRPQLEYWKARLRDLPAELFGRPSRVADGATPPGASVPITLSPPLTHALRAVAARARATPFMVLVAALDLLLHRRTRSIDIVIGTPVENRDRPALDHVVGFFADTAVLRTDLSGDPTFAELIDRVKTITLAALQHQPAPFGHVVTELRLAADLARNPIFQVMLALQKSDDETALAGVSLTRLPLASAASKMDLSFFFREGRDRVDGVVEYRTDVFTASSIATLLGDYVALLTAALEAPERRLSQFAIVAAEPTPASRSEGTAAPSVCGRRVHELFEAQVRRTPDADAIIGDRTTMSYRALNERANRLARHLQAAGAGPESRVGVCLPRTPDLVAALFAVLKAGAAYVPLDSAYPPNRLRHMIADAGLTAIVAESWLMDRLPAVDVRVVCLDRDATTIDSQPADDLERPGWPEQAAYIIYTSGSTGAPKGVVIEHRSLVDFFAAFDAALGDRAGTWEAGTSICFDISVVEILWTLCRGWNFVLRPDGAHLLASHRRAGSTRSARALSFGLFYFGNTSDAAEQRRRQYRLLLEGAAWADRHGFSAVWVPERHFHEFGGLYPNPAVAAAAVAATTRRIAIRAGSVVLPLHDPVRVAEEWALVDNLSQGRVGVSLASGWHRNDFVLAPDRYANRADVLVEHLDTLRRLWRGEAVPRRGVDGGIVSVRTHPRPVQPELPVWITAAGSTATFERAGQLGAHVLTHLLGQEIDALGDKIRAYRDARGRSGDDPEAGRVAVMLHAFVANNPDEVRRFTRHAFRQYLAKSFGLARDLVRAIRPDVDLDGLSPADLDDLLDVASERFTTTSSLIGTPDACLRLLSRLREVGVDEIACLIDFGVDADAVLSHLPRLAALRDRASQPSVDLEVAHLQCTPSALRMLLADADRRDHLRPLTTVLVGGEALPATLVRELRRYSAAELYNVYGPTEATVWSTTHRVDGEGEGTVSIGHPIAGWRCEVVDERLNPVPHGVDGELLIGGAGVARGYWNRPRQTAERFVPDALSGTPGARLYRTGDRVRHAADGELAFIGRLDDQLKIRGYRIEPAEVEAALRGHPAVAGAALVARRLAGDEQQMLGYVVLKPGAAASSSALLEFARERLPAYMVPALVTVLDELPLTPNRKLDRAALAALVPAAAPAMAPARSATLGPLEEVIANVWADTLGRDAIDRDDDFFALGGHSIAAARTIGRVREATGVPIPLRALYEARTVASLAERVAALRHGDAVKPEPMPAVARTGEHQLSLAQQRLWFLHQLTPSSAAYIDAHLLIVEGALDAAALRGALTDLTARHEPLRTSFHARGGRVTQRIGPPVAAHLPVCDLSALGDAPEACRRIARRVATQPFDMARAPLVRAVLCRFSSDRHALLLAVHHIIWDGWSLGVFARELAALYGVRTSGHPAPLPALAAQYVDFAAWDRGHLQSAEMARHLEFWRATLDGAVRTSLPVAGRRAAPSQAGHEYLRVEAALAAKLRALSRGEAATLFTTALSAFAVLLAHRCATSDVVIGTDVAGRTRPETEAMIGFFVNQVVLRATVDPAATFRQLVTRMQSVVLDALDHQSAPFDRVVAAAASDRSVRQTPLFQAKLVLQNAPFPDLAVAGLTIRPERIENPASKFELLLNLSERDGGVDGALDYDTGLFDRATMRDLLSDLLLIFRQVADANPTVAELHGWLETRGRARADRRVRVGAHHDTAVMVREED